MKRKEKEIRVKMNSSVSLPGSKKTYYSITLIGGTCVGKTSIQNKIIGKSINVHAPISTTVGKEQLDWFDWDYKFYFVDWRCDWLEIWNKL